MIWLRSALFFIGMAVSAIVFCPVAILAWPVPPITRMRIIGLWARFICWWLALTCNLRHEVEGLENLPATPGVILSKHQSAWETIMFQVIFPPRYGHLNGRLYGCRFSAGDLPPPVPSPLIGAHPFGRSIGYCGRDARNWPRVAGS